MEKMALTDKHIQRIMEYLKQIGWSDTDIITFIDYITQFCTVGHLFLHHPFLLNPKFILVIKHLTKDKFQ